MNKITPFLWFNKEATDAARYYISIFGKGKILDIVPGPGGKPFMVTFELCGQRFMALNGGRHYKLNEAFSLFVSCKNQREVDHYWKKLGAGGKAQRCGWLKDKFGLSWQIIPRMLGEVLGHPDPEKAGRAHRAMMKMKKLDIKALRAAVK